MSLSFTLGVAVRSFRTLLGCSGSRMCDKQDRGRSSDADSRGFFPARPLTSPRHFVMRSPFIVDAQHRGHLFGRRTHHGGFGCVLVGAGLLMPESRPLLRSALIGLGVGFMVHDWPDRGSWIADFVRCPAVTRAVL